MPKPRKIVCKTGEVVFSYNDYLGTKHWNIVRNEALDACGGLCLDCAKRKPLQVHHLHYKTLGNESRHDLKPLCGDCHMIEHGIVKDVVAEKTITPKEKKKSKPVYPKKKKSKYITKGRYKRLRPVKKDPKTANQIANMKIDDIMRRNAGK